MKTIAAVEVDVEMLGRQRDQLMRLAASAHDGELCEQDPGDLFDGTVALLDALLEDAQGQGQPASVLLQDARIMATEIRRINAEGGTSSTDDLARMLYNAADPCHDWDQMRSWGRIPAESRREEWSRAAITVEKMIDPLFPSEMACEIAERIASGTGNDPAAGREARDERNPETGAPA